jgi:PAS domain S-box-containing protein
VNEALARMAGYDSPADMMKEGVLKTYKRGNDRDLLLKNLREQGKISNFEFEFVRKNGETLRASLSAVLEGETLSGMILDITDRKRAEEERERLILDLKEALTKIKTLSGMLPICSWCKKIRNDSGYWQQIEAYIHDHSDAEFTHGICPDCVKKMYSERKK